MVLLYRLTYEAFNWLFQQINCNFNARKKQLPSRAKPSFALPLVIMVKLVPTPNWADRSEDYKYQRRRIMKALDRLTADYNKFYTLHVDTILPYDDQFFNRNGLLNGKGYREFWLYLSKELKKFNAGKRQPQGSAVNKMQHKPRFRHTNVK